MTGIGVAFTIFWIRHLGDRFENLLVLTTAGALTGIPLGLLFMFVLSLVVAGGIRLSGKKVAVRDSWAVVLAPEFEHRLRPLPARRTPGAGHAARMHERAMRARQETVVDEEILLDIERGIEAVEIADAIVGDPMPQHQVLCARRRPNGIGLDEPEPRDRASDIGGREQAAGDRVAAKVGKLHHERRACRRGRVLRRADEASVDAGPFRRLRDALAAVPEAGLSA